jgi:hypothetical protein
MVIFASDCTPLTTFRVDTTVTRIIVDDSGRARLADASEFGEEFGANLAATDACKWPG